MSINGNIIPVYFLTLSLDIIILKHITGGYKYSLTEKHDKYIVLCFLNILNETNMEDYKLNQSYQCKCKAHSYASSLQFIASFHNLIINTCVQNHTIQYYCCLC